MKKEDIVRYLRKRHSDLLEELVENAPYDDKSFTTLFQLVDAQKSHARQQDTVSLQELCFELSTVRNRNLITARGQEKLKKTVVGFFGMSVGSHAALTWMMESRADTIKIADHDTISAVNLNRLRFGWTDIGKKKIDAVQDLLIHINPFVTILSTADTTPEGTKKIFESAPKLHAVVDAIDDIQGKILLRKLAKKHKIPLISGADVGDNVMLDVERYDMSPAPEFFLGRIPNIDKIDFSSLSGVEKKKLIVKLIGLEENSENMLDSLDGIGDSLATWPQLGATATITGGVIATVLKKIVLGENIASGRYYLSLDNLLVADFLEETRRRRRQKKIEKIKQELNLD